MKILMMAIMIVSFTPIVKAELNIKLFGGQLAGLKCPHEKPEGQMEIAYNTNGIKNGIVIDFANENKTSLTDQDLNDSEKVKEYYKNLKPKSALFKFNDQPAVQVYLTSSISKIGKEVWKFASKNEGETAFKIVKTSQSVVLLGLQGMVRVCASPERLKSLRAQIAKKVSEKVNVPVEDAQEAGEVVVPEKNGAVN